MAFLMPALFVFLGGLLLLVLLVVAGTELWLPAIVVGGLLLVSKVIVWMARQGQEGLEAGRRLPRDD